MNPCQRDGKEKCQRMRISEKTCTGPGGQGLPVVEFWLLEGPAGLGRP